MKKFRRAAIAVIVFLLAMMSIPLGMKSRASARGEREKPSYSAIIEVWQLDMVEGGKSSRASLIKRAAEKFRKKNPGYAVSVQTETRFGAEQKMANGIFPDVISFSVGLVGFETRASAITASEPLGGKYGKACYAAPWAVGGYAIIRKKGVDNPKKLIVSQNEYTMPLIAYYLSEYRFADTAVLRPDAAYAEFVASDSSALLGTQRDLYRLTSRGTEYEATPLTEFSDIVQYAAAVGGEGKREAAKAFIVELCSMSQEELESVGMLSPSKAREISEDSPLYAFRDLKEFLTPSIFTSPSAIVSLNQTLADGKIDESQKLAAIENLLQISR